MTEWYLLVGTATHRDPHTAGVTRNRAVLVVHCLGGVRQG